MFIIYITLWIITVFQFCNYIFDSFKEIQISHVPFEIIVQKGQYYLSEWAKMTLKWNFSNVLEL